MCWKAGFGPARLRYRMQARARSRACLTLLGCGADGRHRSGGGARLLGSVRVQGSLRPRGRRSGCPTHRAACRATARAAVWAALPPLLLPPLPCGLRCRRRCRCRSPAAAAAARPPRCAVPRAPGASPSDSSRLWTPDLHSPDSHSSRASGAAPAQRSRRRSAPPSPAPLRFPRFALSIPLRSLRAPLRQA